MKRISTTEVLETAAKFLAARGKSLAMEARRHVDTTELIAIATEAVELSAAVQKTLLPLVARHELAVEGLGSRGTVSTVTRKSVTSSFESTDVVATAYRAMLEFGRVVVYNEDEEIVAIATIADALDYALAGDEDPAQCRCLLRHLPCSPCATVSMTLPLSALCNMFARSGPATLVAATDATGLVWGTLDQTCLCVALASVGGTALVRKALANAGTLADAKFVASSAAARTEEQGKVTVMSRGAGLAAVVALPEATVGECLLAMRRERVPCIAVGRDAAEQLDFRDFARSIYTTAVSELLAEKSNSSGGITTTPSYATPDTPVAIAAEQLVCSKHSAIWIRDVNTLTVVGALYPYDLLALLQV